MIVGLIGLGRIGGKLALNLVAAGHEVVGFDVVAKPELAAAGVRIARDTGEVAARAEIVLHSLPDVAALDAVVAGLLPHVGAEHVIADLSAYPLAAKARAAERIIARGAVMLDCQISGSPEMLTLRRGVIFASGDAAAAERCRPIFAAAVERQFFVGPFGAATRLKTANNLLVGLNTMAAAEALALAVRGGIDPQMAIAVMGSGAAQSEMFKQRAPFMATRDYNGASAALGSFTVFLDLIEEALATLPIDAPLARVTVARYRQAIAEGHGDEDLSCIYELVDPAKGSR